MHPKLERPDPPYRQLINYYRKTITSGELEAGARLPATRDMATEWEVSYTTAAKALRALQAEGLVRTSNQGTYVSWHETSTYSPRDRINALRNTGRLYPVSEHSKITEASVIEAPDYVIEAMQLDTANGKPKVLRRARINYHEDTPVTYSVSWMPGDLASKVPGLVTTERIPGGTVGLVKDTTGRQVVRDHYRTCARKASDEQAAALEITTDDPVLFGQNWWFEQDGTILEFGESAVPPERWIVAISDEDV